MRRLVLLLALLPFIAQVQIDPLKVEAGPLHGDKMWLFEDLLTD